MALELRERELCSEAAERSSEATARSEAQKDATSAKRQLGEALGRALAAETEAEGLRDLSEEQVWKWAWLMTGGGLIHGCTNQLTAFV